jgi:hypothetical protein
LDLETERVDDVVHEDAILLKMDIEGYEPHALKVPKHPVEAISNILS